MGTQRQAFMLIHFMKLNRRNIRNIETSKMAFTKMQEMFGANMTVEARTLESENELLVMLGHLSEGLFDGRVPPNNGHNRVMESDIDFWAEIRCNYISPRNITKMIWQGVYEFHDDRDFDYWFKTWPVEVQHYAISCIIWKYFKNEDLPFVSVVPMAREHLKHSGREAIAFLLEGVRQANFVTRGDGKHRWLRRRRVTLYSGNTHKSWKRRQWRWIPVLRDLEHEFVPAWEQPVPHGPPVEPQIVENNGWWNQVFGWTRDLYQTFVNRVFPRVVEEQMDLAPMPISSKQKRKMINMSRTFLSAFERHHEKMLVLCKVGRYGLNQGETDLLLYRKQNRVVNNAVQAFLFARDANFPAYNCNEARGMPWRYCDESLWVKEKLGSNIERMEISNDFTRTTKAFQAIIGIVRILALRWSRPFDPARLSKPNCELAQSGNPEPTGADAEDQLEIDQENEMERFAGAIGNIRIGVEQQGDEEPVKAPLKSEGPKETKGGTDKKAYKNVKKGKVSGGIKKNDDTKKETKVNLVMADTRSVQKETVKKQASGKPKPEANPEKNNNMNDIMERPMMIGRVTWDAAQGEKELTSFILPQAYFSYADRKAVKVCQPMTAANMMSQYGYTRFDMKVRAQMNSNKFQRGLLLIWWEPFFTTERANVINKASMTNFPHVWMDASKSNSVEMIIPWTNIRDYFPLYVDAHAEYNYWGLLHVTPFTAIATGEKSSPDAAITFYMSLTNWELHQQVNPKPVETINFATEIMADDGPKNPQVVRPMDREVTWSVQKRSAIDPVVSFSKPQGARVVEEQMDTVATGLMAVAGAELMEKLLSNVSRVNADKPNTPKSSNKMKLEAISSTANGDGAEVIPNLGLTQARVTPMRARFLDTVAPANMKDLISMESFLTKFTVNTTDKEGTSLGYFVVTPGVQILQYEKSYTVMGSGERFNEMADTFSPYTEQRVLKLTDSHPTMLAYLANGFLRWTGPIQFHAIAVKTDLHTMRLGWRYEPCGTTETALNECQKISTPGLIWDLNENNEIKFVAEYAAPQPFLSTEYRSLSYKANKPTVVGDYACGVIELYVVNPLKVSTGVSQSIEVNVFVSGGEGFEFSGLSSMAAVENIGRQPMIASTATPPSDVFELDYGMFLIDYLTHKAEALTATGPSPSKLGPAPFSGNGKNRAAFAKQVYEALKFADEKSKETLELDGFDKTKVQSYVNYPLWHRENAYTWEQACMFLATHRVEVPEELVKVLKAHDIKRLKRWMVVAHMRHYVVNLNELPQYANKLILFIDGVALGDYVRAKRKPQVVEEQMAIETPDEDTITNRPTPDKGVNPFKDGTTTDLISVKDMIGEDFNDMYKICRRYYPGEIMYAPKKNSDPTEQVFEEQFMATCNKVEAGLIYWEFHFPVHPFIPYSSIGVDDAYQVNRDARFTSQWDMARLFGVDCRHDMSLNHQHLFSWLFTFWRGEMREKIVLESDSSEPLFGYAVHNPASYEPAGVRLASHSMLRRAMNYGAVVYRGNVMGGFEFEVPWNQKYSRLLISQSRRSALTDNGTVSIYVPVKLLKGQYRGSDPAVPHGREKYVDNIMPMRMSHFRAWGDNTELLIPRGAPTITYYPFFTENFGNDNWIEKPQGLLVEKLNKKKRQGSKIELDDVCYGVTKHVQAYQDWQLPAKPYMDVTAVKVPWRSEWSTMVQAQPDNDTEGAAMMEHLKKVNMFRMEAGTVNPPAARIVEPQGDEETVTQLAARAQNYDQFREMASGAVDDVDGAIQAIIYGASKLPEVVDKLNTNLDKMNKTWSLTDKAFEAWNTLSTKLGTTSDVVSSVSKFTFDATRVGIIMYSFYQLLTADGWQSKMMAIMTGALALGLSTELVKQVGQWVLEHVGSLFLPNQGMQAAERQGDDDDSTVWEKLVEHIDSFKMFAAGVGALACFYMTQSEPCVTKTTAFAGDMINKLKNFTIVGGALRTFDWMFKWIATVVDNAFTWACDMATGGMLTRKILANRSEDMIGWLTSIEEYNSDFNLRP
nr:MAG: RNA-dependent RNA polymerase [Riboviria sp.]